MPEDIDTAEIDSHFDDLGDLVLDSEDGDEIKIRTYACKACGSLVIVKRAHWDTHNSLPTAWV